MIENQHTRDLMQRHLDELIGDRVTLTIHTGDPGPDGTDNLAFGDGLPQPYSFSDGGGGYVGFPIPAMPVEQVRVPLPRRWWQLRTRYRTEQREASVCITDVMMWSNGRAMMTADLPAPFYWLRSGTVFLIRPNKPRLT